VRSEIKEEDRRQPGRGTFAKHSATA
jgi:hypothetical protein